MNVCNGKKNMWDINKSYNSNESSKSDKNESINNESNENNKNERSKLRKRKFVLNRLIQVEKLAPEELEVIEKLKSY
jgi:hypothetical protein